VVSWGSPRNGGDSSALDGGDGGVVRSLQATQNAFAAVKQEMVTENMGNSWDFVGFHQGKWWFNMIII